MKVTVFSAKKYDQYFLDRANAKQHEFHYVSAHLSVDTLVLAQGSQAVCCFVNDDLSAEVIRALHDIDIHVIALRCAGYNNLDLHAAEQHGIRVCRVPAYSPHAVAEHAVALILDLNRNIHRAHNRIRDNNYALDGLMGFDLYKKTVGIIGAGNIGRVMMHIMRGFGCQVIVADPNVQQAELPSDVTLLPLSTVLAQSDIVSLHCPLTPQTRHLINHETLNQMKDGVMLINTSRGMLIDTKALLRALKERKVGYLGIDVYEEEGDIFFEDLSDTFISDDIFARLQTFPNVIITGHQAFFTREALQQIAQTTLNNLNQHVTGVHEETFWLC